MKLKCPVCVKHIGAAVGMLIVLLLSLEAGLRLHERHAPKELSRALNDSPLTTPSPRCFYRMKPLVAKSVANEELNRSIELKTNSLGIRGRELAVPKPAGVFRILLLGDEATLAPETPDELTTAEQLRAFLQPRTRDRVEVVNAGVPGYCPLLCYLKMKHALLGLQPDLIVLNFDMSDVADDHLYRRFTRITRQGEPLVCRNPALSLDGLERKTTQRQFRLLEWVKRQVGRAGTSGTTHNDGDDISSPQGKYAWLKDRPPDWAVHIEQALSPIPHLNSLASRIGARLVVAAVPAPWQISAHASNTQRARLAGGISLDALYRSRVPFEALGTFLKKHHIPYCSPEGEFRSTQQPAGLFLKDFPRFSPAGHQLFARALSRIILREVPAFGGSEIRKSSPMIPARSASHRNERSIRRNAVVPPLGERRDGRYD